MGKGLFGSLADFLFGRDADIFDRSGKVRHRFDEKKWRDWDARFKANPEYDWRLHAGAESAKSGTLNGKGKRG